MQPNSGCPPNSGCWSQPPPDPHAQNTDVLTCVLLCLLLPTSLLASSVQLLLRPRLRSLLLLLHYRFGSLDNILASRSLLKPFGAAHRLLGEGQPGADARCVTAARNLAVLRMRPQQQQLPVQQLQECYSQACASLQGPGMLQPQNMQPAVPPQQQQPQQRQEQQLQQQQMKKSQRGSFELPPQPDTSLLHPARQLHMQQCRPYLQTLQECLREVGWTQQLPNWRSPSGLWCDLLVQVPAHEPHQHDHHQQHEAARVAAVVALTPAAAGVGSVSPAGSATSSSGRDVAAPARARAAATGPLEGGTNWVAFQVLSPGDLCSGESWFAFLLWVGGCCKDG